MVKEVGAWVSDEVVSIRWAESNAGRGFERLRHRLALWFGATLVLFACAARAGPPVPLTIGYQTEIEPSKAVQADGMLEHDGSAKITWKRFDSGADVIAALASNSIQIGYLGSAPLAAAVTRQLPIRVVFIASLIGDAEAMVVRPAITGPSDLLGKHIATPFASTAHYSLLAALHHWGITTSQVKIVNLRPPEIIAAWARGDIDAAYVWDPALGNLKETGHVLARSADVAEWGSPTFDVWVARNDFAAMHGAVVTAFVAAIGRENAAYRDDPKTWLAKNLDHITGLTGARAADVPGILAGSYFPLLDEQASPKFLGHDTAAAIAATSAFLHDAVSGPAPLADYTAYIDAHFVAAAAGH